MVSPAEQELVIEQKPKVLVYGELLREVPRLYDLANEFNVACVPFTPNKFVLTTILDMHPLLVVLPELSGELNGVKCCWSLKTQQIFPDLKVALVSKEDGAEARERANRSGCDIYGDQRDITAKIRTFLRWEFMPNGHVDLRSAPRFNINQAIQYNRHKKNRFGHLVNASQTGIFFVADEYISPRSNLTFSFSSLDSNELDLAVTVVRVLKFSIPFHGCSYGIGASFDDWTEKKRARLFYALRDHL